MDEEGDGAGAELLDEEMAEEVVILGEVAHVHDLGGTPCEGVGVRGGRGGHRGGGGQGSRRECCGGNSNARWP